MLSLTMARLALLLLLVSRPWPLVCGLLTSKPWPDHPRASASSCISSSASRLCSGPVHTGPETTKGEGTTLPLPLPLPLPRAAQHLYGEFLL